MFKKGWDDFTIVKVGNYLKTCVGEENAVCADEIERLCDVPHKKGNALVRNIITLLLDEGLPILSCDRGYFLAKNHEEVVEYLMTLEYRVHGILERKMKVINAYENFYSQD